MGGALSVMDHHQHRNQHPNQHRNLPALPRAAWRMWVLGGLLVSALLGCGGSSDGVAASSAPASGAVSPPVSTPMPAATPPSGQVPVPTIVAVSANVVPSGGVLTVQGTDLDKVTTFRIGEAVFGVGERSATQAQLIAPMTAVAGVLALDFKDVQGLARQDSAFKLEVYVPASVTRVTPTGGAVGTVVRLTGQGLDATVGLKLGGTALAPAVVSATEVNFTLPAEARTGALSVITRFETITVPGTFTVVPPVKVNSLTVVVSGDSTQLTLKGQGLSQISQVRVGAVTVPAQANSDTELVVTIPGTVDGEVLLDGAYVSGASAGSFSRAANAPLVISNVVVAQAFALPVGDGRLRLVAGRAAMLKLDLTSAVTNLASPSISVTAVRGQRDVAALPLNGPAQVPAAANTYDLTQSYHATLPADWVQSGTTLRIDVKPPGDAPARVSRSVALSVDAAPALTLTVVPVSVRGVAPTLPSTADIRAAVLRAYPMADNDRFTVRVREPYTYDSGGDPNAALDANRLLQQVDTLRRAERPTDVYFGMVEQGQMYASGPSGLAYINRLEALRTSPYEVFLAAIGEDRRSVLHDNPNPFGFNPGRWANTMIHEMGHVFTRRHAPCWVFGNAPDLMDTAYPYGEGRFSEVPLFDGISGKFTAPEVFGQFVADTRMVDVMGYCEGNLFSDYNYFAVHAAMQAMTAGFSGAAVGRHAAAHEARAAEVREVVSVTGTIGHDRVTLEPLTVLRDVAWHASAQGTHRLCGTTESGETHCTRFTPVPVGDGAQAPSHFAVVLPQRGPWQQWTMERDGQLVYTERVRSTAAATMAGGRSTHALAAAAASSTQVQAQSGGSVRVTWDATRWPQASLTLLTATGERRVVALGLRTGQALVRTTGLPAGGQWAVDLQDRMDARRELRPR